MTGSCVSRWNVRSPFAVIGPETPSILPKYIPFERSATWRLAISGSGAASAEGAARRPPTSSAVMRVRRRTGRTIWGPARPPASLYKSTIRCGRLATTGALPRASCRRPRGDSTQAQSTSSLSWERASRSSSTGSGASSQQTSSVVSSSRHHGAGEEMPPQVVQPNSPCGRSPVVTARPAISGRTASSVGCHRERRRRVLDDVAPHLRVTSRSLDGRGSTGASIAARPSR